MKPQASHDPAGAFLAQAKRACLTRAKSQSGKSLTALHMRVCNALAYWRGRKTPTHAQLARAASCSISTVQRALKILHEFGLLSWTRRVVGLIGHRAQIANEYHLMSLSLIDYRRINTSVRLTDPGPKPDTESLAAIRSLMEKRRQAAFAARNSAMA